MKIENLEKASTLTKRINHLDIQIKQYDFDVIGSENDSEYYRQPNILSITFPYSLELQNSIRKEAQEYLEKLKQELKALGVSL